MVVLIPVIIILPPAGQKLIASCVATTITEAPPPPTASQKKMNREKTIKQLLLSLPLSCKQPFCPGEKSVINGCFFPVPSLLFRHRLHISQRAKLEQHLPDISHVTKILNRENKFYQQCWILNSIWGEYRTIFQSSELLIPPPFSTLSQQTIRPSGGKEGGREEGGAHKKKFWIRAASTP